MKVGKAKVPALALLIIIILIVVLLERVGKTKGDPGIDPATGGAKLDPNQVYGPPSSAFAPDPMAYTGVGSVDYYPSQRIPGF